MANTKKKTAEPVVEEKKNTPLPVMSGQPLEVQINDQLYTLSPLTLDDYGAFDQFAKQQMATMLAKSLRDAGMDSEFIADRIERNLGVPLTKKQINQAMMNASGQVFVLWRSIRQKHPEMTREHLGSILTMQETVAMVERILASGQTGDKKNG